MRRVARSSDQASAAVLGALSPALRVALDRVTGPKAALVRAEAAVAARRGADMAGTITPTARGGGTGNGIPRRTFGEL